MAALGGEIQNFPPVELLQGLHRTGSTGLLKIEAPPLEGEIVLKNGLPVHAVLAAGEKRLEGKEVFLLLPALKEGHFALTKLEGSPPHTVPDPLEAYTLLLRGQEFWQRVLLPGMDRVLRLRREPRTVLTPDETALLTTLEGQKVGEALLGPNPLRRALFLQTFFQLGILEARMEVRIPPTPLQVLTIYGPGGNEVFVDEELYRSWVRALQEAFTLRLLPLNLVLPVKPRFGIGRRLGVWEGDMKRFGFKRGQTVPVVPEP